MHITNTESFIAGQIAMLNNKFEDAQSKQKDAESKITDLEGMVYPLNLNSFLIFNLL